MFATPNAAVQSIYSLPSTSVTVAPLADSQKMGNLGKKRDVALLVATQTPASAALSRPGNCSRLVGNPAHELGDPRPPAVEGAGWRRLQRPELSHPRRS